MANFFRSFQMLRVCRLSYRKLFEGQLFSRDETRFIKRWNKHGIEFICRLHEPLVSRFMKRVSLVCILLLAIADSIQKGAVDV